MGFIAYLIIPKKFSDIRDCHPRFTGEETKRQREVK